MIIKTGITIECKKCNKIYDINPEDFDEPETSSDERSMGYEIQYIWTYELECEDCNNVLKVVIEGYEYPTGILNYEEFNVEGSTIISEPSLEINYTDEDSDYDL